jgi:hypothetical protein
VEKEKKRQKLIAATEEEYEKKAYSAETSDESIGVKVNGSSDSCRLNEKVASDDIQNQVRRQRICNNVECLERELEELRKLLRIATRQTAKQVIMQDIELFVAKLGRLNAVILNQTD